MRRHLYTRTPPGSLDSMELYDLRMLERMYEASLGVSCHSLSAQRRHRGKMRKSSARVVGHHIDSLGFFRLGTPMKPFVKNAERLGLEAVALYPSIHGSRTLLLARTDRACSVLAVFQDGVLIGADTRMWRAGREGGVSYEAASYRDITSSPLPAVSVTLGDILPMAMLGFDLVWKERDLLDRFWSIGSGAETAMSWHHGLFTPREVADAERGLKCKEDLREARVAAIPAPFRDVLDTDRSRTMLLEDPALETALRKMNLA